jgi:mRNA interferase MazF
VVNQPPRLDEVWLVSLDPTRGSEIQKARPCLVISPDEMNQHLRTVIIAPMTTADRPYPTRVAVTFRGKRGQVALDQMRAVDRQRLVRKLGTGSLKTAQSVSIEFKPRGLSPSGDSGRGLRY